MVLVRFKKGWWSRSRGTGRSGTALPRAAALLALAALSLLASATAASAAKPSQPPQLDTAAVSGDHFVADDFAAFDIRVDAFSGPSGENPGGEASFGFVIQPELPPISGPVSCLKVTGNTAILRIDGPFSDRPGFLAFIVRLVDNGGGGLDTFEFYPLFPELGMDLDCETGAPGYFGGSVDGRVQVTDAPPPPTSKAQCKNGSYAVLGFANQGLCMSSVARG